MNEQQSYLMWPGGGGNSWDQRRRMAMAMMSQKRAFPKTFGEGLASIGDSIGDIAMMKYAERLAREERADADKERGKIVLPGGATVPTNAAPATTSSSQSSEVQVDAPASVPVAAVDEAQPDPNLQGQVNIAAAPAAAPVSVEDGGFNSIDAAAHAPRYLQQDLIGANLPPARTAYLGQLASKEAKSPTEVSSTGAAGPFQFTRGTGRQYGLVGGPEGDKRTDIARSIVAANRLTDDNAATLRARLGREPTPGELALAHQQGSGTAASMLQGTGNASAHNLAVNNAGGLGPQAAASRIMNYYAMPGGAQGAAGGPAVAQAPSQPPGPPDAQLAAASPTGAAQDETLGLLSGRSGGGGDFAYPATASRSGSIATDAPDPGVSPATGAAIADTAQARRDSIAKTMTPPPPAPAPAPAPGGAQAAVQTDITPAPAPAPGQQVAQAAPATGQPAPSYAPPKAVQPVAPPPTPKSEQELINEYRAMNSPHESVRRAAAYAASQYRALRENTDARNNAAYTFQLEQYKADRQREVEYFVKTPERTTSQTQSELNLEKTRQEIAAGKRPHVQIVDGRLMQFGPTGWTDVTPPPPGSEGGGAPPVGKLSEAQSKAFRYAKQMMVAGKDLGDASALANLPSAVGSSVPVIGGALQSKQYREAHNAATRFVMAKLRDDSGATIGTEEFKREWNAFFPSPTDDAQTVANKATARRTAMESMIETAGPGSINLRWQQKNIEAEAAQKAAEINEAKQWLQENPNDPRAATVRKKLGM